MADSPMQLSLQFLTPAFVGGATPRQGDPYLPLRPSEVRGLLRTWFRMAVAALFWPTGSTRGQEEDLVRILLSLENELFGTTDHRSPFAVTLDESAPPEAFVPPSSPTSGLRYLGYGLFEKGIPTPLPTGKCYKITLRIRPGIDRKLRARLVKLLPAIIWLWTHLGGIGARSRRGFGSMELTESSGFVDVPSDLLTNCSDVVALEMQLRKGLNWALDVFEEELGTEFYANPEDGKPHPAIRNLLEPGMHVLPTVFRNGKEALESVGSLFLQFRNTRIRLAKGLPRRQDYFVVRNALQTNTSPNQPIGRTAFGLPLRFYFSSLGGASCNMMPPEDDRIPSDRVPSPLHIRVHRIQSGQCAVTLLNLAQDARTRPLLDIPFLQMKIKSGSTQRVLPPDGSDVREFVRLAVSEAPKMTRGGGRL